MWFQNERMREKKINEKQKKKYEKEEKKKKNELVVVAQLQGINDLPVLDIDEADFQ